MYNAVKSELRDILQRNSKGTVFGPLIFITCVADLHLGSRTISYCTSTANDVVMNNVISEKTSLADFEELQDDLDEIATWGAENGMELNASNKKCRHVTWK
jgi:hypothetical protein